MSRRKEGLVKVDRAGLRRGRGTPLLPEGALDVGAIAQCLMEPLRGREPDVAPHALRGLPDRLGVLQGPRSYVTERQSRSTKMVAKTRPRPLRLSNTPVLVSRPAKAVLVNCDPWSEVKSVGVAIDRARSSAVRQNLVSIAILVRTEEIGADISTDQSGQPIYVRAGGMSRDPSKELHVKFTERGVVKS